MINKQKTTQEKIAYLAGIIDGEGHIGVYKTMGRINMRYRVRVGVSNTNDKLLEWLMSEFGGFYKSKKVYKSNHKVSYFWQLADNDADYLLEMVLPYLIIKKQQAILVLCYRKLQKDCKTHPGYSSVSNSIREEVYNAMKHLNMRGPLESVETNTLDINKLLMKIESELTGDRKSEAGDSFTADL